ncbi:hypothetical protein lerEdw1_008401 [Lerista edwardsae]|nr:hypothetical protein lerEdw1_008401 [Lerista edwardsae]
MVVGSALGTSYAATSATHKTQNGGPNSDSDRPVAYSCSTVNPVPTIEISSGGDIMDPLFCFIVALLFVEIQSCPEACSCIAQKRYGRHIVDCSYQDFQEVPFGLPSNATTLSLSVNRITALWEESFFELADLQALQQLKLSNNRLERVPLEAFRTLKELRSLWLNDNRLAALSEGTFDSMPLLALLQISNNPWDCSCRSWWLKRWLESTSVSIPEKESVTCAAPVNLKSLVLGRTLKLDCMPPSVQLAYHSSLDNTVLHDGLTLLLHCSVVGKPPPEIRWKIQTASQNIAINGPNIEGDRHNLLADGTPKQTPERLLVFNNGSMAVSKFSKTDEGIYTCQAINEVGSREVSVKVALASSENFAEGLLQNNIQASKPRTNNCDKEELPKSDGKVVFIYLTPVVPKTSHSGGAVWEPWSWSNWLLVLLLALYS